MRKIFIFIILISLNSCSFTEQEIYRSAKGYKAWAVTIDAKAGGYMVSERSSQAEANRSAIIGCETYYNHTCLVAMEDNYNVWNVSVDEYNQKIQDKNKKAKEKMEIPPPSYSCSGAKCTAN